LNEAMEVSLTLSWVDYVNGIAGSLTALIALIAAIAGYIKYSHTKNREIYEKILKDVYAPLYRALFKQETFREFIMKGKGIKEENIEDTPILTFFKEKNGEIIDIFGRTDILNIGKQINAGLASPHILELLSSYEITCYFENELQNSYESFEDYINKDRDEKDIAKNEMRKINDYISLTISKVKIEKDLYTEIIRGYCYYNKKLGLESNCSIKNGEIIIGYKTTKDEIQRMKDTIRKKNVNEENAV